MRFPFVEFDGQNVKKEFFFENPKKACFSIQYLYKKKVIH